MPEFFLELFSEEIPARMQRDAAQELLDICDGAFFGLAPENFKAFYGPRRLAVSAKILPEKPGGIVEARGPRDTAPESALIGFLNKHFANKEDLITEGGYYILRRNIAGIPASKVILDNLPVALAKFSWPKSMRWGQGGDFTWVRPLRRIILLLDGEIMPISLGPLTASNETQGHRVLGPGVFSVSSAAEWEEKLRAHFVVADQRERKKEISESITQKAASLGLSVAEDVSLLDEVTGLIEWPVALVGKIDEQFMDLPWEVRELSMKVNQKYFALRDKEGKPAPYFSFVANLEAPDGGAAIVAGNERVLRARLSDARHFWDLDQKTPLDALLPKLEKITFHAKIGTQRQRADRIASLSKKIAELLHADGETAEQARWAGLLSKADLVTGMVGEFPELQGIMGGYYAERHMRGWEGAVVGPAIKTHYQPKGPSDAVPTGIVPVSVALADKLDTLVAFFRENEKPTGSGDPYALRRAALGVIRIILENNLRLHLKSLLGGDTSLFDFIIERLRVKLRGEGKRFDVLDAVLAAGADDDLVRVMKRVDALSEFLITENGMNLLAGYRRASNILKIETTKDGPYEGAAETNLFQEQPEKDFAEAFSFLIPLVISEISQERYGEAMKYFADLRKFIDAFFQNVTVNASEPEIRRNRLKLLARFRDTVHQIADFSKIEG
jgi:glycyl-tRNA synthetase beta chain